jgi:hypothetical protein
MENAGVIVVINKDLAARPSRSWPEASPVAS